MIKAQATEERIALQQALTNAEIEIKNLKIKDFQSELENAKANLVILENRLEQAENRYDDYEDWSDTSLSKAEARINLANAQQQLEEGITLVDLLENRDVDLEIENAETELSILLEQLWQAQERENSLQEGQTPEELTLAEKRLNAAKASVTAAQEALNNLRLIAPFDGVILDNSLKIGQLIVTGQRAVVLADTTQWLVETNNVTEIDRMSVSVGQSVTVTPDSMPALQINGTVLDISDYFQENRGDITYQTMISLEPVDENLFWGMTVLINFETE
jgi:multidrug resistance efflux pump